jgi:hypothetical protein
MVPGKRPRTNMSQTVLRQGVRHDQPLGASGAQGHNHLGCSRQGRVTTSDERCTAGMVRALSPVCCSHMVFILRCGGSVWCVWGTALAEGAARFTSPTSLATSTWLRCSL